MKKKTLITNLILPVVSAIAVAGLAYAVWTEPGTNPPGDNAPAPINIGPDAQYKEGALGIWGVFKTYTETILATNENGEASGNVGIGTNSPNSPAPNSATAGNIDVNDAYIRSINKWVSEMNSAGGGGGSFTYHCYSDTKFAQGYGIPKCQNAGGEQGFCPPGFRQAYYLGTWGQGYWGAGAIYTYCPPLTTCTYAGYTMDIMGDAYVCTKGGGSGWYVPSEVKVTSTGNTGKFGGYKGMYDWIQTHGCAGFHVCDATEITRYYQTHPTDSLSGWYIGGIRALSSRGPDLKDCNGFTSNEVSPPNNYIGLVWRNGAPTDDQCNSENPVMCCR